MRELESAGQKCGAMGERFLFFGESGKRLGEFEKRGGETFFFEVDEG